MVVIASVDLCSTEDPMVGALIIRIGFWVIKNPRTYC